MRQVVDSIFRFLPRDATQSAVLCDSMSSVTVCTSVRDVQVRCSHTLEYFKNNFTAEYLKVPAHIDPNMGDLVQREHPPK